MSEKREFPIRRRLVAMGIAAATGLFFMVPKLDDPAAAVGFMWSAIILAMMWAWASDPFGPKP